MRLLTLTIKKYTLLSKLGTFSGKFHFKMVKKKIGTYTMRHSISITDKTKLFVYVYKSICMSMEDAF